MIKKWQAKLDGRKWSQNKIMSEILKERGIMNLDRFLYPVEEDLLPLEDLNNIKEAAKIFLEGISNQKKFFVYYDTDNDGIASGTIITRYLSQLTDEANITPYINEGKAHGLKYVAPCFSQKYDIVIIVDSIETDTILYEELLNMGTQIIVLDHHDLTPSVLAMQKTIHLVSSMNEYDNPDLCGAGVALKFCLYIDTLLGTNYADNYYDLAACGICADMMSVGFDALENRYICYRGFSEVKNKAIKKINGSYEMNSTAVSFGIAPLINAANRMNQNWNAMKLFLSDNDEEISDLIKGLKGCREKQNLKVNELYSQIEEQAKEQENNKVMFFVIDDSDNMSGLLANKALGQYQKPIIITQELTDENTGEQIYSGSLRASGVDDFSKMVNKTRYAKAMGHSNAAGFTMQKKNKEKFTKKIEEQLASIEFEQNVVVDIQLTQKQVDKELVAWLKKLNKISGQGFTPITVMIEDIDDYIVDSLSGGRHTKIITPYMLFIKWNSNDWEFIPDDMSLSAIGTLDQSYFGKKFHLQMIMDDYRIEERIDLDEI